MPKYFYRSYHGVLNEADHDDAMMSEANAISSFGDIPLTLITAIYANGVDITRDTILANEYISSHLDNQKELSALSTRSRQVFATQSAHFVPLQEPELIISDIRSYLQQ